MKKVIILSLTAVIMAASFTSCTKSSNTPAPAVANTSVVTLKGSGLDQLTLNTQSQTLLHEGQTSTYTVDAKAMSGNVSTQNLTIAKGGSSVSWSSGTLTTVYNTSGGIDAMTLSLSNGSGSPVVYMK